MRKKPKMKRNGINVIKHKYVKILSRMQSENENATVENDACRMQRKLNEKKKQCFSKIKSQNLRRRYDQISANKQIHTQKYVL